jgi:pimeloyl-ACP methyl ester carboxylesterase
VIALLLAAGNSVTGISTAAAAAPPAIAPAAAVDETFEREECPVDVPAADADRVTCHVLIVPERRTAESDPAKTLRLPVVVIESRSEDPAKDPLVFPTTGGPGGGSLSALWYFLDYADWVGDRDIILIEQRGDMLAEPTLNCSELDIEHFIEDGALLAGDESADRYNVQMAACRERLVADGVDLAAYTSAESAADLAQLRTALGFDTWNLYGISYGSRLAMTMMRDHPEGLRSVIVDGPYPPNVNRYESLPTGFLTALDALFAQCAADAACHEAYPGLERSLTRLLAQAADTPIPVVVTSPVDGSALRVDVSDTDLTSGLFQALYSPATVRVLPFLIDQLAQGNAAPILPLAQQTVDYRSYYTEGLDLSVECAEEVPFNDPARLAEALAADPILEHYAATLRPECLEWPGAPVSEVENQAVTSEIPTLIMNGGYDPVTPLAYGEAAAAALSMRYLYSFPTMGHGAVWENWVDGCPASIAQQFIDEPATEPDSSCIAAMPATDFLTTDDIYPTTAIYRLNSDVVEDRDPIQIAIAVTTIVLLIATLVYAIIYGLSWLIRRRGGAPAGAVLAAATASGLFVAFAAVLGFVVLTVEPLILGFGVPPAARPLVIVPLIAIAATVLLIAVVVRAWIVGDGTLFHRVALSLSAGASLVFAIWLIARGLLIF